MLRYLVHYQSCSLRLQLQTTHLSAPVPVQNFGNDRLSYVPGPSNRGKTKKLESKSWFRYGVIFEVRFLPKRMIFKKGPKTKKEQSVDLKVNSCIAGEYKRVGAQSNRV